ncbi:hypothetical protein WH47_06856 [Habropoda laboriosa]|uniref:CCHC-type domain-containing protein n=1 Tax=Habropoda laboriosa TaxID=597456 RepID=A0A0L7QJ64_9HYME|nr:hypothetical protein WH47_06856 [Habropoda laboriosa]
MEAWQSGRQTAPPPSVGTPGGAPPPPPPIPKRRRRRGGRGRRRRKTTASVVAQPEPPPAVVAPPTRPRPARVSVKAPTEQAQSARRPSVATPAAQPRPARSQPKRAAKAASTASVGGPPARGTPTGGVPQPREDTTWSQVVGRKARRAAKAPPTPPPQPQRPVQRKARGAALLSRPPRSAAVTLTVAPGSTATYAGIMATAREKIKIEELGITEVRPRRARTGALILEVAGPGREEKAEALATRLREVLHDTAKVAHPSKFGELRVSGLEDSAKPEEVAAAVAAAGGCPVEGVRTGAIRSSPNGLGTVWVRCPLAAARKLATAGRLRVGWVAARVEALRARPLQCYRCLEKGHTQQRCTAGVDRSRRCYRCGDSSHRAGQCPAADPKCPLCTDLGRPAGHRLGAKACAPPPKKGRAPPAQGRQAETQGGGAEKRPSKDPGRGEAMITA